MLSNCLCARYSSCFSSFRLSRWIRIRLAGDLDRYTRGQKRTPRENNISPFVYQRTTTRSPSNQFKFKFINVRPGQFGYKTILPTGKYALTVCLLLLRDAAIQESRSRITDQNLNYVLPLRLTSSVKKDESSKKKKRKENIYTRSFVDHRFGTILCFTAFVWRNAEIDVWWRHRILGNVGEYLMDHDTTCPKLLVNFVAPLDRAVIPDLFHARRLKY